jgi:hypothetical protein
MRYIRLSKRKECSEPSQQSDVPHIAKVISFQVEFENDDGKLPYSFVLITGMVALYGPFSCLGRHLFAQSKGFK